MLILKLLKRIGEWHQNLSEKTGSAEEMARNIETDTCKARFVLQQCLSAKLMVQPASVDTDAKYVEVNPGCLLCD